MSDLSTPSPVQPPAQPEPEGEHDVVGFAMHSGLGPCLCGHARNEHEHDGVSCFCRDDGCFCVNYEPA